MGFQRTTDNQRKITELSRLRIQLLRLWLLAATTVLKNRIFAVLAIVSQGREFDNTAFVSLHYLNQTESYTQCIVHVFKISGKKTQGIWFCFRYYVNMGTLENVNSCDDFYFDLYG